MKNTLLISLMYTTIATGCSAQNNDGMKHYNDQPYVSSKVTKEVDENGNLIRYDSTYVWKYTTKQGELTDVNIDSVIDQFKAKLNVNMPFFFDDFNSFYTQDSMFYRDFLSPNFFTEMWKEHLDEIEGQVRGLDSMREAYLKDNYPNILLREDNSEKVL